MFLLILLNCSESRTYFEKYGELEQKAILEFKNKDYGQALSNFEKSIKLITKA